MSTPLDARTLRDAFGAFLTGVTVVTTSDHNGTPLGFTANSFSSVSLDPPLLSVCLAKTASSYPVFSTTTHFAVNILAEDQKNISNTFARPSLDRFSGLNWHTSPHGSPVLADVAAWFDCTLHQRIDAGDHLLLLGEIKSLDNSGKTGLGYARGAYFTPAQTEHRLLDTHQGTPQILHLIAERNAQLLLVKDAKGGWTLPALQKAHTQSVEALAPQFSGLLGLPVQMGLVYSIYEDTHSGQQHIVYRANLGAGDIQNGALFEIAHLPLDEIKDSAIGETLKRYSQESLLGNFGVYFGNQHQGQVHALHPHHSNNEATPE